MRLLWFPTLRKEPPAEPARDVRRLKTHCETCGAPTVRGMCPPAAGQVHLVCLTCEHQWCMPDRRASLRPADPM
ncbi:MAG TPA: hypothetical protein VHH91_02595 [Vicinamibacterales bacterium]|nr:hypothetical protein [Vicinamibacterales bacterium]